MVAIALIVIGAAAVYGGNFGRDNVQDRLQPEKVVFPPFDAMTPAEQQELGNFAGQTVDTGPEAEGFARYIGGHLAEVNEGATYSETSSAAREEGWIRRRRQTCRRRPTPCSRVRPCDRSC